MYINNQNFKTIHVAIKFIDQDDIDTRPYRFLLPKLLIKTTDKFKTPTQLDQEISRLYSANISVRTEVVDTLNIVSLDLWFVHPKTVDEPSMYDEVLSLLHSVVFEHQSFESKYIQILKDDLISQLKKQKDNKPSYAFYRFNQVVHGKQSLSAKRLIGNEKEIRQVNQLKIEKYYKEVFLKNKRVVFINGDVDASFSKKIEALFNHRIEEISTVRHEVVKPKKRVMMDSVSSKQAYILLGYQTPYYIDYHSNHMLLAHMILGGSAQSRLFLKIREEMNLSYQISSQYNARNGLVVIYANVDSFKYQRAIHAINDLVEQFIKEGITDEELRIAKKLVISNLEQAYDDQYMLTRHAWYQFIEGRKTTIEEAIKKIKAISKKSVNEAIKTMSLMTTYVLGGQHENI